MCLLDFILRYELIPKKDILVVNFDHGIRDIESERDSHFVVDYCRAHDIDIHFTKTDIPLAAIKSGRSIETEAREFRKAEYTKLVSEKRVSRVMLAHNLDDHTESVLMHIFRGSGLKGLIGPGAFDNFIIRPLIEVPKTEILEYVKINEVPYVNDSTNDCSDYSRNYIRLEILPKIKKRWPNINNAVQGLSDIAKDAYAELAIARGARIDGDSAVIAIDALSPYSVLEGFAAVGIAMDISKKHIASVIELAGRSCGVGVDVPHGGRAVREYDDIRLFVKGESDLGEIPLSYGKITFGQTAIDISGCEPVIEKHQLRFDVDKLPSGCVIRTRRDGDMFKPCLGHRKLLSDYLTDKKIPKYKRDRLALIAHGSEIFAVIGIEISDKIKLTNDTKRAAQITV